MPASDRVAGPSGASAAPGSSAVPESRTGPGSRPGPGNDPVPAGNAMPGNAAGRPGRPGRAEARGAAAGGARLRLPPVRLAPREELAGAARVAPLLRAARDLARWASGGRHFAVPGEMSAAEAAAAAEALELAQREVEAAFRVAVATGMLAALGSSRASADRTEVLSAGDAEEVLTAWDSALAAILTAEDLDGLATALYTVGGPVRMDGLFDAYAAAAGTRRREDAGEPASAGRAPEPDETAAVSHALETLADLAVVELGTDESAGGLTVALSPLGVWGVHRRLRAQGWHVPVLGGTDRNGAAGLLVTLASCDAEDGEAEIAAWLEQREPAHAAAELIDAAATGSPGLRGAAFAVLDRIGAAAAEAVRAALAEPVLRAHAAVWLHEHGEEAELRPEDRTWLLVDLGAGLLEEADPRDVVAELLPELPGDAQAEIVAGLWQVSHPGVTELLTALSDHHPDPAVARAARKAAFKARSPAGNSPSS
jgi:hypothetical protein